MPRKLTTNELKTRHPIRRIAVKLGLNPDQKGSISCPFKNNHKNGDRHKSMKIWDETNTYYCFTCGQGGDGIDLIKKLRNVTFKKALQLIVNY